MLIPAQVKCDGCEKLAGSTKRFFFVRHYENNVAVTRLTDKYSPNHQVGQIGPDKHYCEDCLGGGVKTAAANLPLEERK